MNSVGDMKFSYKQMTKESSELFLKCILMEQSGKKNILTDEDRLPFFSQIVKKRIEVLKLPVEFTEIAIIALNCLVSNPGEAVVLLIDALNKFEGGVVNVSSLVEMYPFGFYDERSFDKYVDDLVKNKKIKWAEIY